MSNPDKQPPYRAPPTERRARPAFGRTGLASILFAIARPGDARAASVDPNALTVAFRVRSLAIPLQAIETVEVERGWWWRNVTIYTASRPVTVSGLARRQAQALAEALEAARVQWWQRTVAAHAATIRLLHDRVKSLSDPPRYLTGRAYRALRHDARHTAGQFPLRWPETLSPSPEFRMLLTIRAFLDDPDRIRTSANETFVANELTRSQRFFDQIEARPLTDEQRSAVVIDEDCNLVVAAAGSGKTSVIVAKSGWLVWKRYRHPSELLLLAFARDARSELEDRVGTRLGEAVAHAATVRTFHSLGLAIIGEAEGRRPSLSKAAGDDVALRDLLKRIVADLLADRKISRLLLAWFQDQFAPYKSGHEFRTYGEYWDYIRRHEIRSLNGEKVKSFEECEIANFLYLNGVAYEYERDYEHDTATPERRQYQPDFYLRDAGIYIEHFALSGPGDTPPFIDRDQYLSAMQWKRQLHDKHGTVLIETYSHERAAGKLTANLAVKLKARGVELAPIAPAEVFSVLDRQGRIDPFTNLVATFLQHFKGSLLTLQEVAARATTVADRLRAEAFLSVFGPIFERYENTLSGVGQIDFHDMINKAADHVASGRYRSQFGYILVDEFQDISPARARLLKALLDQKPDAQLFAVGDDWQAIYRFAGSEIAIMREFQEHFGQSERIDLETTFRCCAPIAAVATEFILKNPAQLRKTVRATRETNGAGCTHRPSWRWTLSFDRGARRNRRRRGRT